MKKVFFRPRVGINYSSTGINGKKLLILGESHICGRGCGDCGDSDKHPECIQFTNNAIKYFLNYKTGKGMFDYWMNTYTKFGNIFNNKYLSADETVAFWDSVVFYNYVQYSTDKAGVSPGCEEFEKSSTAFTEVLEEYQPDMIIVWGKRLWEKLPSNGSFGKEEILFNESDRGPFYYYTAGKKKIPAFMINHPCSSKFDYTWYESIQKAIGLVKP